MPLYEYECDACGHRFERIQKFSDPLADTCPKCGGPVHKLMSSPAIQFKGSGFYITDYAKKDHVAAQKADGAGEKNDKADKGEKSGKAESKTDAGTKSETSAPKTESSTTTPSAAKDTKST